MFEQLFRWLLQTGLSDLTAVILARLGGIVIALLVSLLAYLFLRYVVIPFLHVSIIRSKPVWDDLIDQNQVLNRLALLAPAIVIFLMAPLALEGYPQWIAVVNNLVFVYVVVVGILISGALLNALVDIYYETATRQIPLRGFVQVVKIVLIIIGVMMIGSIVLDRTVLVLLGGLGASTAVLLLVFQDAILGLVAGIQLTANKMLVRGDWIELPQHGANGEVLDVALTTVKIQNWDKTITMVPTQSLVTESFRNWRGMQESGGRRIKRSIFIDVNTIRLLDEALLTRLRQIQRLQPYLAQKEQELKVYNAEHGIDDSSIVNGRRLTNIGTFRAYVIAYLQNHPMVNQEMLLMARQLDPTPNGLPLEIYAFCRSTEWLVYESVQADIFDHLFAVLPAFELRAYQNPAGTDFQNLLRRSHQSVTTS